MNNRSCANFKPAPVRDHSVQPLKLVAPVSTVILVPKSWTNPATFSALLPPVSNIDPGKNWTDMPAPDTVVLIQQPQNHISAILGDIMVTRLLKRHVAGVIADGRIRDVRSCKRVCQDTDFQLWSKGFSAAGPSLEAKPWAVNIPLVIGQIEVKPGDIICADEEDEAVVVIPQHLLEDVYKLLPILKEASDRVFKDVSDGLSLVEAVKRNPNFYSNYK